MMAAEQRETVSLASSSGALDWILATPSAATGQDLDDDVDDDIAAMCAPRSWGRGGRGEGDELRP